MTQEDKELLLRDLNARLPYKVVVQATYKDGEGWKTEDREVLGVYTDEQVYVDCIYTNIENIKPYLRLISSMTKEEGREYRTFIDYSYNDFTSESTPCVYVDKINNYIDWLFQHHFDFRGLIEKGLALEAPKEMYNIK